MYFKDIGEVEFTLGYNKKYNINIEEQWVPWGRCYTIKSYNVSRGETIYINPIHNGHRPLGSSIMEQKSHHSLSDCKVSHVVNEFQECI